MMSADDQPSTNLPLLALLQRGVRWFSDELLQGLDAAGVTITPSHTVVLAYLEQGASLSIAELARRAGVTRQTMHRAVTQLVAEGLLTSRPGPGFPRSTLVELTAAGCQRRDIASSILHELEQVIATQLGTAALVQLRESLEQAWPSRAPAAREAGDQDRPRPAR